MDLKIIYMNDPTLKLINKTLNEVVGTSYAKNSIYPIGTKYCPITALKNGTEAEIYYAEKIGRYLKGASSYFMSKEGKKIGYIIATFRRH